MRTLLLILAASLQAANIPVTVTSVNQRQAVISFTPTVGTCTLSIVKNSGFVSGVADLNASLFTNANQCTAHQDATTGTIGGVYYLTIGAGGGAQIALNGLWVSRALESGASYTVTVAMNSGADSGSATFTTSPPRSGNTWPEPIPFNVSAPYNYAWPTIRAGVDRNTFFADPTTGVATSMFSAPVPVNGGYTNGAVQCFVFVCAQPGTASFDAANNGNWSTACAAIGGSNCVNSTANQDPLFIRLKPWCVIGASVSAPGTAMACPQGQSTWTEPGIDQTQYNTIDDIQAVIAAAISGSTTGMQFALTVDGVNPATDWQSQTLTTSSASYPYPATGAASGGTIITPGFPSTQYGTGAQATTFGYWFANQATARLTRPDMQPHTGIVTIGSGGSVTWSSGEPFRMSSCAVGSHITLVVSSVNTDYQVTACTSPVSLTIASPPTAATYNYIWQNFGLLIRKAAATTGNLTIGGASFSDWESAANTMPIDGTVEVCQSSTVTDSSGTVWRLCSWIQGFAHVLYAINESTGVGRFLGVAEGNGGCFSGACAPGVNNPLNNFGQPTATAALGSVLIPSTLNMVFSASDTDGNFVLIQGSYNPSGAGSCPNNYQEITIINCPTYPFNNNITYINATPKVGADSADHTPITQATNYAAAHSLVFSGAQFSSSFFEEASIDQVNGSIGMTFAVAEQDYAAWFVKFNTGSAPFTLNSMGNSYSSYNCRFCVIHGSGSTAGYENISTENTLPVCSGVGCGEFDLQTTTSTGTSTPNNCTGIIDPNFTSFNGTSNCFDLTLAGTDPCHLTPNLTTEVAPTYGTCSWNGSYTHLVGVTVQVGDLLDDTSNTGEMFRVVNIPSSGVIRVLRAYATPSAGTGPYEGQNARTSSLTTHTEPWNLRMLCSANSGIQGGQAWFNLNTDPTAQNGIVDYPTYITGHADWWTSGAWAEVFRYRTYSSLGAMAGAPNSFSANQYGPFGATAAFSYAAGWEDSHAGLSRDPNNPLYTVDKNPLSSALSAVNTLWPQTATNVSGSLWKIAAANVQNNGASSPAFIKWNPLSGWSGGYLLNDISGPSSVIDGTSANYWNRCTTYIAGECFSGSASGDVYVNVPQSAHNAPATPTCGPWDYFRSLCVATLDATATGLNQYAFGGIPPYNGTDTPWDGPNIKNGLLLRSLGHTLDRHNFESVFSSAHGSYGGQWVFAHSDYYGGGLRSDLFIVRLPQAVNADTQARNGFIPITLQAGAVAGTTYARLRWWYAENGGYCTSREEACYTAASPTSANPYYFASDATPTFATCTSGCTLQAPAIPGRVLYWVLERLSSGGSLVSTTPQAPVAVQ